MRNPRTLFAAFACLLFALIAPYAVMCWLAGVYAVNTYDVAWAEIHYLEMTK